MKPMQPIYEQFGWKEENTRFLAGTILYGPKESELAIGDADVNEKAKYIKPSPKGDLRRWVSIVNRLTSNRIPAVDFAILAGFGASLMPLLEVSEGGTIISLVNRSSGTGKSMVLKIICSIWGQWDGLNQKTIDTHASKGINMAVLGNLPITFDEMASICADADNPEALRNFIEIFTGGRDKLRAKQFGGGLQATPGHWSTLLMTSSNYSLIDLLETQKRFIDAPGLRIIEWLLSFPDRNDHRLGDEMEAELWANAGHAGPAFIQHCLDPDVMRFIKRALKSWTAKIWEAGGFKPQHRFWVRAIACIAVAGELAASLGLVQINVFGTVNWSIAELQKRIALAAPEADMPPEKAKEKDSISIFGEFINSHLRDIMIVSSSWTPGSRPLPPEVKPSGQLLIRYEREPGRLFIPIKEFKVWAIKQGYAYNEVIEGLKKPEIIVNYNKPNSLGKGTGMPSAPVPCIEFNMKHPLVHEITQDIKELKNDG